MEVIVLPSEKDVASLAADCVCTRLKRSRSSAIGLPTGSTPLGMYRELVERYKQDQVDFSQVITFNLDEYIGLPQDHPSSYYRFMSENFFNHVNIPKDNIYVPNGMAKDVIKECRDYEKAISKEGGIDLQILGIGGDGHIAFNEPSSSLASRTRLKTLTAQTKQDNAKHFANPEDVPDHVITMGIGTIMEAHRIILLATGEKKAQAIAAAVEGPITAMCPASVLQFHPRTTFIVDEAAAKNLQKVEYYKTVYEKKPEWQRPV